MEKRNRGQLQLGKKDGRIIVGEEGLKDLQLGKKEREKSTVEGGI